MRKENVEEVRKKLVKEFRNSHKFVYEFAEEKGIKATELREWLKKYPIESLQVKNKSLEVVEEFGIINISMNETSSQEKTDSFKFESEKIKIEVQKGYDKKLLQKVMEVLVRMINDLLRSVSTIYIAYGVTDFRKQIEGLCEIVTKKFELDPYKKEAFIFCNKKRTSIKVLVYDKNGFILAQKTLLKTDKMKYQWPRNKEELKEITKEQLQWLLSGLKIYPEKYFKEVEISQEKIAI